MRRLAKQDREDQYASRRDYQQIECLASNRLTTSEPLHILNFACRLSPEFESIAGFGGYILSASSTSFSLRIWVGDELHSRLLHCGPDWSRFGLGFKISRPTDVLVELEFDVDQEHIDTWGFAFGLSSFPAGTIGPTTDLASINVSHLLPETLYLPDTGSLRDILQDESVKVGPGSPINLKKCSYCQRRLPLGPGQPGRLSFHKHNAKISGHQNECRACKKWRINDSFNPLRTVDQLNESSIITRERRLLLREPEILQNIKEREGRGLKSITWERFDKKCFYCSKPLELSEVQLDHTRPLAYLWPIDEYATCLCAEHNNHKKDKFPVDFYTPAQLERLAAITGLPVDDLKRRDICEPQLQRIREDLPAFARACDPRAFNAIARKLKEVRPDLDLYAELQAADSTLYEHVLALLAERPETLAGAEEVDDILGALED